MCFNDFKFVGDDVLGVPLAEFKCSLTGVASPSPTAYGVAPLTDKHQFIIPKIRLDRLFSPFSLIFLSFILYITLLCWFCVALTKEDNRVLSLSEKQNRGMGIARGVCKTNAKPTIKTEESVLRKQNSVRLSLFCFFTVIFFACAKSDIFAAQK